MEIEFPAGGCKMTGKIQVKKSLMHVICIRLCSDRQRSLDW
jgi:hypothetical protein